MGMDRRVETTKYFWLFYIQFVHTLKAAVKKTAVERGFVTYDVIIDCNILK